MKNCFSKISVSIFFVICIINSPANLHRLFAKIQEDWSLNKKFCNIWWATNLLFAHVLQISDDDIMVDICLVWPSTDQWILAFYIKRKVILLHWSTVTNLQRLTKKLKERKITSDLQKITLIFLTIFILLKKTFLVLWFLSF